jgi:hypothetical protein
LSNQSREDGANRFATRAPPEAERCSSGAAAALRALMPRGARIAAAVYCSSWFGAAGIPFTGTFQAHD